MGDDVYGDDPTVNRLQAMAAERLGHEAALFLPTGTQSNLVALLVHCARGDEYIVGADAHTYKYEGGGARRRSAASSRRRYRSTSTAAWPSTRWPPW